MVFFFDPRFHSMVDKGDGHHVTVPQDREPPQCGWLRWWSTTWRYSDHKLPQCGQLRWWSTTWQCHHQINTPPDHRDRIFFAKSQSFPLAYALPLFLSLLPPSLYTASYFNGFETHKSSQTNPANRYIHTSLTGMLNIQRFLRIWTLKQRQPHKPLHSLWLPSQL